MSSHNISRTNVLSISTEFGLNRDTILTTSAEFDRARPNLAQIRPNPGGVDRVGIDCGTKFDLHPQSLHGAIPERSFATIAHRFRSTIKNGVLGNQTALPDEQFWRESARSAWRGAAGWKARRVALQNACQEGRRKRRVKMGPP